MPFFICVIKILFFLHFSVIEFLSSHFCLFVLWHQVVKVRLIAFFKSYFVQEFSFSAFNIVTLLPLLLQAQANTNKDIGSITRVFLFRTKNKLNMNTHPFSFNRATSFSTASNTCGYAIEKSIKFDAMNNWVI